MDTIIDDSSENKRLKYGGLFWGLLIILVLLTIIGGVFKYLHWPGGNTILFATLPFLGGMLLVQALFRLKRKKFRTALILLSIAMPILLFLLFKLETGFIPYIAGSYSIGIIVAFFIRK